MSDLTRRVLNAQKHHGTGAYTTRYTEPTLTCANAAPVLARQVEAVEALADRLDREAEKEREKPNRTLHDHGWDDACTVAAYRIRAALNSAEKGNTP